MNSTWILDLNRIPEILKELEEVLGTILEHIGIVNDFLNRTPTAQQLKESVNKQNCIKPKSLCTPRETFNRFKRVHTEWEKIFTSYTSHEGLISIMYRELKNSTPNKSTSQFRSGHTNWEFSQKKIQMAIFKSKNNNK
jgi:hypothetical protein